MIEALIGFAALLSLSFLRVPIAISMVIVGFVGMSYSRSLFAALNNVGETAFGAAINYELSVVPLFVLMGNFVTRARLSEELYTASNAFLGHRKGGLAMATIVACGGFSAVCGSSLATAATMSKVAMPSMRRYGYDDGLAAGSIAAGGTLGILIPPSVLLVIYGILTQTSIGKLFAAGVVPGIIGILFYLMAVRAVISIWPHLGPRGERTSWPDRFKALQGVWGVLLLFACVMGGIYGGVFSATEAAGIGAIFAFVFYAARQVTGSELLNHFAVAASAGLVALLLVIVVSPLVGAVPDNFTFRAVMLCLGLGILPLLLFVLVKGVLNSSSLQTHQNLIQRGIACWRAEIVDNVWRALVTIIATAAVFFALGTFAMRGNSGDFTGYFAENSLFIVSCTIFGYFIMRLVIAANFWGDIYQTLLESAGTTAMLFTVLIGALVFANFINYTTFPQTLLGIAATFKENPWFVLIAILVIYVLLGCVFESLSMILLTVPIFFPLIKDLGPGFGLGPVEVAVWYGIVVVVITEISLITPPVGLNVFVLRGVLPDVKTSTIFRGVTAYWIADIFRLALIVGVPVLSLWLPSFVK